MKETKTEPTPSPVKNSPRISGNFSDQESPVKPAAKSNEIKSKKSEPLTGAGVTSETADGVLPPKPEAKYPIKVTLSDFDAFLKAAPKEWLPTMMVRIANKCMAEKVFASAGAMAEAIVGASKGK